MKVVIVEDEQPAAQKLTRLLAEIDPNIEIVIVLESVEKVINWFRKNPLPNLIFMDIELEDGLCFEIFENCVLKVPVIFTTAYDEYTLKAFKVNSIDYLLKPIDPVELKNAIEKFNELFESSSYNSKFESLVRQMLPTTKERFLIKIGEHYKPVEVTNILGFYIKERCNFIFTDTGKSLPLDHSLDKIEQLVDSNQFFRINRNFTIPIINFHG
jgi:two-component system, LytTR family, response regulator LytT